MEDKVQKIKEYLQYIKEQGCNFTELQTAIMLYERGDGGYTFSDEQINKAIDLYEDYLEGNFYFYSDRITDGLDKFLVEEES